MGSWVTISQLKHIVHIYEGHLLATNLTVRNFAVTLNKQ